MSSDSPVSREDFPHFQSIPTRWMDNDVYGHVNNVVYYSYFDTAINEFLIRQRVLELSNGKVIGVCAESHCRYREAVSFPEAIQVGLRVGHLGKRSVRYELGIFKAGRGAAIAQGYFVHVFVDRQTMRPISIPDDLRAVLVRLIPGKTGEE
ncbi:MAG: thioesterase family protein [Anaerolineales bacterium]|nr:thioesterase family protein [Anaerolineales bacterium]